MADPVLDDVIRRSNAAGLPPVNVPPNQGRLLAILVKLMSARRVLERR